MRKTILRNSALFAVVLGVASLTLAGAFPTLAQLAPTAERRNKDKTQQLRSLLGKVMDKQDAPLPDSVVYLKNTKTLAVKTFIADKDGNYRFHTLSPNVDYEVYAELANGKKSDVKTLSAFDSRAEAYINLHINPKKE